MEWLQRGEWWLKRRDGEVILRDGREWWFAAQGGLCPTSTPFVVPPNSHVSRGNREDQSATQATPAATTPARLLFDTFQG